MDNRNLINSYLTAPEAAEFLGLTRNRIGRLCLQGRFEGAVKKNRFWLIPREAVENYTRLRTGPKPKTSKRADDAALIAGVLAKISEQSETSI